MRNTQFEDQETKAQVGQRLSNDNAVDVNVQYHEGRISEFRGQAQRHCPRSRMSPTIGSDAGCLSVGDTWTPEGLLLKKSRLNVFYQFIDRRVRPRRLSGVQSCGVHHPRSDNDTFGVRWVNAAGGGDA